MMTWLDSSFSRPVQRHRVEAVSRLGILTLTVALLGQPAAAQVQRSGGAVGAASAQLQQMQQQMQQAVAERTQLQADNARLKKEADELKKQLSAAQGQAKTAQAGAARNLAAVAAAKASGESAQRSLQDSKTRMQELIGRFRETVGTMHAIETDRSQLRQQLTASQNDLERCTEANAALYQINMDVLDRYQHQSALTYLERAEPFTRLKRTQIDNLALEYRQKADELRIKRAAAAPPPPPPNAPIATVAPPSSMPSPPQSAAPKQ